MVFFPAAQQCLTIALLPEPSQSVPFWGRSERAQSFSPGPCAATVACCRGEATAFAEGAARKESAKWPNHFRWVRR